MKKAFGYILKVVAFVLFACLVFVLYPRKFEGKYYSPMLVQGVREKHWIVTENEIITVRDSMEGEVSDVIPYTSSVNESGMKEFLIAGERVTVNKGFNYWYFSFEPMDTDESQAETAYFYRIPW